METRVVFSSVRTKLMVAAAAIAVPSPLWAADEAAPPKIDFQDLVHASGVVGVLIFVISLAMVALIIEHLLTIRRGALMPYRFAQSVNELIRQGRFQEAEEECREKPCLLSHLLAAGLVEAQLGYPAIEKAMEDAAVEHSARMLRKVEYLAVIVNMAPMMGLLGTVWGMILAFLEFEAKANPQVSELAPGIYRALVTTLLGLSVAVPALASYAIFRNRIEQLVAECSLMAEHMFSDFKRKKQPVRTNPAKGNPPAEQPGGAARIPSVTMERGKN